MKDLGFDLLTLSKGQLLATLIVPFIFFALYFIFAAFCYWIPAVVCTMGLSFTSYGSTSHDLVHENLKINKRLNTVLLSFLEFLCFRSGHAYRESHLYHHRRFPNEDDVEGAASRMSLVRTLFEGVIFQLKIYVWAIKRKAISRYHTLTIFEGASVVMLILLCCYSLIYTEIFFVYMVFMVAGSWIIPLITSYAVHSPLGSDELNQTRLFRGRFFSIIAFDHLYHLEHHLYPMVPHKNWPKLANRLDYFFRQRRIEAVRFPIPDNKTFKNG